MLTLTIAPIFQASAVEVVIESRSGIAIVDVFQAKVTELELVHSYHNPVCLADGSRIAAIRTVGRGRNELFVIDRDSRKETQVTSGVNIVSRLALSRDGNRVGFISSHSGELHVFDLGSGETKQLTRGLGAPEQTYPRIATPVWSPDSTRLAFVREPRGADFNHSLLIVNAEHGAITTVLENQPVDGVTDWSPDGQRLGVYIGFADGFSAIVALNEKPPRIVEDFANSDYLTWSPDGAFLALTEEDYHFCASIHVKNLRTGRRTKISGGLLEFRCFAWPSWSPDSKYLIYTGSSSRSDMSIFPWPPNIRGQLYLADVEAGSAKRIADPEEGTSRISWCPPKGR